MKQSFFQQTPVKIECSLLQMWKVPKLATLQTAARLLQVYSSSLLCCVLSTAILTSLLFHDISKEELLVQIEAAKALWNIFFWFPRFVWGYGLFLGANLLISMLYTAIYYESELSMLGEKFFHWEEISLDFSASSLPQQK